MKASIIDKKILVFFTLFLTVISCNREDTIEIISDQIHIESNLPYIIFDNDMDLINQLNEAISFPSSNIPVEALEKVFNINPDSTLVEISLKIKKEFSDKYTVVSEKIELKISSLRKYFESIYRINNPSLTWANTDSENTNIYSILCNKLDDYDFDSASTICIPITFHVLQGAKFKTENIPSIIQNLNENFADSKIQFEHRETLSLINPEPNNFNFLNVNLGYELENDPKVINCYVADYIGTNEFLEDNFEGLAHYPNENKKSNSIFARSIRLNSYSEYQSVLLTHEIGHLFSLHHLFDEVDYSASSCIPANICHNDGICTTPETTSVIPTDNLSCDDTLISNFMSYSFANNSQVSCQRSFVQEQNKRMRFVSEYWYSELFCHDTPADESLLFYRYDGVVYEKNDSFRNPTFSNDGMHMYAISDGKVIHYSLNKKYDLSNLGIPQELQLFANGNSRTAKDIVISSNGNTIYVKTDYIKFGNDLILQYDLPTPFSLIDANLTSQKEIFYAYNYLNLSTDNQTLYLLTNASSGQGVRILGYRFGISNDVSTLFIDSQFSSPWIGYPNSFLPTVLSKTGDAVIQSPVVGSSRIIRRFKVEESWILNTMNLSQESHINPDFSSNTVVEFYDDVNHLIFVSSRDQGSFKLHRYSR